MKKKNEITSLLLQWYGRSRRDLPWRDTVDPYRIWVSEIILQQTRVAQGLAYYHRFLERFPVVEALAAASLDEVLKVWEGLGYYSRARNMHAAARIVVEECGGRFPGHYDALLRLKGVGPYTAAAIASIAFGEAVPVLDGNVFRVVARLFAVTLPRGGAGDREVRRITQQLIPAEAPGDFNQALMELGALICTPDNPACGRCPVKDHCLAFSRKITGMLPAATPTPKTEKRYLHYLLVTCDGEILISQRSHKDIWYMLWEFPLVETEKEETAEKVIPLFGKMIPGIIGGGEVTFSGIIRHQLTHRTLLARFYHVSLERWPATLNGRYVRTSVRKLKDFAFPRLITGYMESLPERFGL